jgi:hypothetical protein
MSAVGVSKLLTRSEALSIQQGFAFGHLTRARLLWLGGDHSGAAAEAELALSLAQDQRTKQAIHSWQAAAFGDRQRS